MFYIVTTIFVVSIFAAVMFVFGWHVCCCYVCGAVMFVAGCYVCCCYVCCWYVCHILLLQLSCPLFVCLFFLYNRFGCNRFCFVFSFFFLQEKINPRTIVVQRTRCVARLLQNLNLFRSKTDGLSKAG